MKKIWNILATNLLVHELMHFLSGIIVGLIFSNQLGIILTSVLVSLLIDADHYFEGIFSSTLKLNWRFIRCPGDYWKKTGRFTLLFHSWEILPVILIIGRLLNQWPIAKVVFFATATHYLLDSIIYFPFNPNTPILYFLSYRICHKFRYRELCKDH